MRKPLTGEPCAGEPHARFGGRGGRESFSTPIDYIGLFRAWVVKCGKYEVNLTVAGVFIA